LNRVRQRSNPGQVPTAIPDLIRTHAITHVQCTPTHARMLLLHKDTCEALSGIDQLLVGGESCPDDLADDMRKAWPKLRIQNMYGPTETTIWSATWNISSQQNPVLIGQPIANTQLYVLDGQGQLLPPYVPGELYIAGEGLAQGYHQRPELTADRFMSNPFQQGERMYRTGDLAEWQADGHLRFLGRADHQIKLRGYRIEPGEIEKVLVGLPAVQEAVVLLIEAGGVPALAAYIRTVDKVEAASLRRELKVFIPDYMIPDYFVTMDVFPKTPNGKLDRKALPHPREIVPETKNYVAPRNLREQRIQQLWEEVLDMHPIGIHDNFFEIGGQSLKATILIARLSESFDLELRLRDIFGHPSIAGLSELLNERQAGSTIDIQPTAVRDLYPLSHAQKRLWVVSKSIEGNDAYHDPQAIWLKGQLDHALLEKAFQAIIQRHEILRTIFVEQDNQPMQAVLAQVDFQLPIIIGEEGAEEQAIRSFIHPFDLGQAPLLRAGLVQLSKERHILLIDMPHIVSDGPSLGILMRDLVAVYNGEALQPLKVQYKDFAIWQNKLQQETAFQQQADYWQQKFASLPQRLNLQTDFTRPDSLSFEGRAVRFELDSDLSTDILAQVRSQQATTFIYFLTCFNVLLHRLTAQECIVVGAPVGNRDQRALEEVVGCFLNTLPFKNHPRGHKTFLEFLKEVRDNTFQDFAHQDYPFDLLVQQLGLGRDRSRQPLFDVWLDVHTMDMEGLQLNGLAVEEFDLERDNTKFDLTLLVRQRGQRIDCILEYNTNLFQTQTANQLAEYLQDILEQVAARPDMALNEIELGQEQAKPEMMEINTKFNF
ncbi:MAG: condensation domain-containing protein, partial [Bacteroidota bacterium]